MSTATRTHVHDAPTWLARLPAWGMSLLTASLLAAALPAPTAMSAETPAGAQNRYVIFFTPESTTITPAAQEILAKAVEDAVAAGTAAVSVRAFAARDEGDSAAIAAERAQAVADALIAGGVDADYVRTRSATVEPAPRVTAVMDRRVEIQLDPRQPAVGASSTPWKTVQR